MNILTDLNNNYSISGHEITLGNLTYIQIRELLQLKGQDSVALRSIASDICDKVYLKRCFVRGVIEISNKCNVNCQYCLMQRDNKKLERYRFDIDSIEQQIKLAKNSSIKTIMFQSGESRSNYNILVKFLKNTNVSDLDIIVCVGNLSEAQLNQLKELNVKGVIIKFETLNKNLFADLQGRKLAPRIKSILNAKRKHLQISTGSILGLPDQTLDDITNELLYLQYLRLPMNSVSPFIPAHNTKLQFFYKPNIELVLNYIALLRLANPVGLIPSVSALNLLQNDGQNLGLKSGANVLTCNFTTRNEQKKYKIYDESRFIVEYEYVKKLITDNGLENHTGWALGPKYLDEKDERLWFDMRYNDSYYNESVYGKPSIFFQDKFIPLMKKGFKVIDLGGGDGRNSVPIANKVKNIISIDNNSTALNRLKKRLKNYDIKNVFTREGNVESITDFEKYDCFILSNLLYYFEKDKIETLLNNLLKTLSKQKYLYLSFESNILMSSEENEYFFMSAIYNYTLDDILKIVNNKSSITILNINQSEHCKRFPLNRIEQKDCFYKRSILQYEILLTGK